MVVCDGRTRPELTVGQELEVHFRDATPMRLTTTNPGGPFQREFDGVGVSRDWFLWADEEPRWFDVIAYRTVTES